MQQLQLFRAITQAEGGEGGSILENVIAPSAWRAWMCRPCRKRPIDVTTASSEIGIKSNVYTSHVARLIERHTHAHMLHTWGYSSTATTCRRPTTWAVVDRLKRSPSHTRWNGKIARSSVARRDASVRLARSHTSSHSSVREKRARACRACRSLASASV